MLITKKRLTLLANDKHRKSTIYQSQFFLTYPVGNNIK